MANIFWIPNSPIKEMTIQYRGVLNKNDWSTKNQNNKPPSFLGYGTKGALSRFKVLLKSFRNVEKRHPSPFAKKGKGVNNVLNKELNICAKFVGNFVFQGIVSDQNSLPIANCTVKLFRAFNDMIVGNTTTDATGLFRFNLANDSYHNYYITVKRTDIANTAGITSYLISPVQT